MLPTSLSCGPRSRCAQQAARDNRRSDVRSHGDRSALSTLRRRRARPGAGPGLARAAPAPCSCSVPSKDSGAGRRRADPLRRHRRRRCSATSALLREDLRRLAAPAGRARDSTSSATLALGEVEHGGGLELMDETRVEVDIEISRAMQLIDSTAEWELRELQTFTSTLVGQQPRQRRIEPVSALGLRDRALGCRLRRSSPRRSSGRSSCAPSAGVAAGLLKNAAAAASTRLESQGVQPGLYRTVVLPSGADFGRPVAGAAAPRRARAALLSSMPGAYARPAARRRRRCRRRRARRARAVRSDGARRRNSELEQALLRLDELLRHPPIETS